MAPGHAGQAPKDSLFRVSRYARDHAGIKVILAAAAR